MPGRLFFEVLGHDRERFAARLDKARSCCDSLAGMDIQPGISPHAAYTCGEGNLLAVRDAASAGSVPLAIHIAESSIENDFLFDTSGPFLGLGFSTANGDSTLSFNLAVAMLEGELKDNDTFFLPYNAKSGSTVGFSMGSHLASWRSGHARFQGCCVPVCLAAAPTD